MKARGKLCLMLWKQWKMQLRDPFSWVVDYIIPLILLILLIVYKSSFPIVDVPAREYPVIKINSAPSSDFKAFTPDISITRKIMKSTGATGFIDAEKMEEFLVQSGQENAIGVQFSINMRQLLNRSTLPKEMIVHLRLSNTQTNWMLREFQRPTSLDLGPRNPDSTSGGPPDYNKQFIPAMKSLTDFVIDAEFWSFWETGFKVSIRRFPEPAFTQDNYLVYCDENHILMLAFVIIFFCIYIDLVTSISYEKERLLKISMQIMGMPNWILWTSWFLRMLVPICIVGIITIVVVKWNTDTGRLFEYSGYGIVFFYVLFCGMATTTFAFAVSEMFNSAVLATVVAILLWIMGCLFYFAAKMFHETGRYLSALCVPVAIGLGTDVFLSKEASKQGVTWGDFFTPDDYSHVSFGGIILMLLLDTFLYLLLTLYFEAVIPGHYGSAQKWNFCFTMEYWFKAKIVKSVEDIEGQQQKSEFFEDEPKGAAGIQIMDLHKRFGANFAVKNMTLNMYEGQILALLGRDGAGKTTTINILTGLVEPTDGTATVNGYDIRKEITQIRDSTGICFQHNVLFKHLTVREHFIFFSKLKGLKGKAVKEAVNNLLETLDLKEKAKKLVRSLSPGMKRKLCVGLAFCGDARTIILDQPSTGMDLAAKQFLWDYLKAGKKGRTILLATHLIDEADTLGDRVAIIHAGEIQCCASSYFLKRKYGVGYTLSIEMAPACMPDNITATLRRHIANIRINNIAGTELSYMLPKEHSARFSGMLYEIETSTDKLAIRGFTIAATDLEEVYLRVATGKAIPFRKGRQAAAAPVYAPEQQATGFKLWINQILAMLLKKFHYAKIIVVQEIMLRILIPFLFIIIALCIESEIIIDVGYDEKRLSISDYPHSLTLVEKNYYYRKELRNDLRRQGHTVQLVPNILRYIKKLGERDPFAVRFKIIVGYQYQAKDDCVVWFNNEPYHALPMGVQYFFYSAMRKSGRKRSITYTNYPWRLRPSDDFHKETMLKQMKDVFVFSILLIFYGGFLIKFYVIERASGLKHLQIMSGVNLVILHFVSFLWDVCLIILEVLVVMTVIAMFQPMGVDTPGTFYTLYLIYICFVMSIIPLSIILARCFYHPCISAGVMCLYIAITGPGIIYFVMTSKWAYINFTRTILRLLIAPFTATEAIFNIVNYRICGLQIDNCLATGSNPQSCQDMICSALNCCGDLGGQTSVDIIFLLIQAAVLFLIIFLLDFGILNLSICGIRKPKYGDKIDDDVKREIAYINDNKIDDLKRDYVIISKELTKYYGRKPAVNGLTFMLKKSECLGLLGVKGAGKTTAVRMLTGDKSIGYGSVWINGYNIKRNIRKIRKSMGICPAHDALMEELSVRTTVQIFCLIRGVPRKEYKTFAEEMVRQFELADRIDEKIEILSFVNRRKLLIGIALLGDSPILIMDEPTRGMDPVGKRNFWTTVNKLRNSGRTIIIASSSLDECEALCNRVAVMRKGDVQCIGSLQRLKGKFAKGYIITFKLRKPKDENEVQDNSEIDKFMQQRFPGAELKDVQPTHLNYILDRTELKWSQMFDIMEGSRRQLNLEDYSIGQPTLDQVFMKISMNPVDLNDAPDETSKKWLCC